MEKQGVIRDGLTNPEHEAEKLAAENKKTATQTVKDLDNDFRKRAAEVARVNNK